MSAPRYRFATLAEWLAWQERLHPSTIELGLDRVRAVLERLHLSRPADIVIAVGGTNGKGSTVAFLEAILQAAGYRVGSYLSPHVLRYNERVRIVGREIGDAELCAAFERVDAARGDTSLTYFEFGTLAALDLLHRHRVEVALLEVGLGGRLDAVNAVDSDCAVITTIDLDHCEWLGPDRDSIGFEKAGIFRTDRPAVCADPDPPPRLLRHARELGTRLYRHGMDYRYQRGVSDWGWDGPARRLPGLPLPALSGAHQLANAAAAVMALEALQLGVAPAAIGWGLEQAWLPGRLQRFAGAVEWIYDVAHNPQAAGVLTAALAQRPCRGRTHVVLGMLADKDCVGVAHQLAGLKPLWYSAGLEGARGQSGEQLMDQLVRAGVTDIIGAYPDVAAACEAAGRAANAGDRIVICGSFHTVAKGLRNGRFDEVSCG